MGFVGKVCVGCRRNGWESRIQGTPNRECQIGDEEAIREEKESDQKSKFKQEFEGEW